jgi:RNA polymerase sigma factor (sigma-70 family)
MVNANDSKATWPMGPELLGRLFDRHAAALEFYASQLCDCPQDVVQEALVQLAGQAQPPADLVAWLYRVVRNKALNASRSARRRRRREAEVVARRPTCFHSSPEDALDAQAAADALSTLPEHDREVIVVHVWGGLSFAQIAELIGVSDSTAHRRYQAALSKLRDKLGVQHVPKRPT